MAEQVQHRQQEAAIVHQGMCVACSRIPCKLWCEAHSLYIRNWLPLKQLQDVFQTAACWHLQATDEAVETEASQLDAATQAAEPIALQQQQATAAYAQQHEAGETAAAIPAPPPQAQQQAPQQQRGGILGAITSTVTDVRDAIGEVNAQAAEAGPATTYAHVAPLPTKNFGSMWGGSYPFMYDPVYGLPIVRDVAKYSEVLRDIRLGKVRSGG